MHIDDISRALDYGKRDSWLNNAPWIFMLHRSFSWLVLIGTAWMAYKSRGYHAIRKQANYLLLTMICSMLTGIVLYYLDMPAVAQPVHLLLAAAGITINMTMILRTSNAT
jgi:cytochrome c oxidase assembly protein subunit 15